MRTPIASLVLLASALTACADAVPTLPTSGASGSVRSADPQRSVASLPFSGSCTLTFNAPPLPLPPVIHQVDVGTCRFTHLGRTDFYGELDINFATGTQSGWRTLTAANGDELHVTTSGTNAGAVGGMVTIDALLTIAGGTGRFTAATGSARATGLANLATRTTVTTIEGSISY